MYEPVFSCDLGPKQDANVALQRAKDVAAPGRANGANKGALSAGRQVHAPCGP